MKLIAIFITIASLYTSASAFSQINISVKNSPIEKVLKEIKKQSGYSVFYDAEYLSTAKPVTLNLNKASLDESLRQCFMNQPFTYHIISNTIVIKPNGAHKMVVQETKVVTGKITNEKGEPLMGASVRVKIGNTAVSTNNKGVYSIKVNDKAVLVYSFLGFSTQEIPVNGREIINVKLIEEASSLNQVVVIGYGSVSKKDLTGSVASVDMGSLMEAPVASFDEALAGRVAGVHVSANEGQPGSAMKIVIRGQNSITQDNDPLFVVDGFPMEDFDASSLSTDDIESMTILKDASATAIYGARGANGVVVIETKKGTVSSPTINYTGYVGTQKILKTMEVMSPYEFVNYQIQRDPSRAATSYLTNGKTLDYYKGLNGYDWQNRMFKSALKNSHALSVRGGTAQTKYSFSTSLYNQDGIIVNSSFDRIQGRLTIDQTLSKKAKATINLSYSDVSIKGASPAVDASQSSNYLLYSVWGYRPITGTDNGLEEDLYDPDIEEGTFDYRMNPIVSTKNEVVIRKTRTFTPNLNLVYNLTKKLTLNLRGGLNINNYISENFYNDLTRRGSLRGNNINGVNGSVIDSERRSWLNENTLTYKNSFKGGHKVSFLGGFTMQAYNYRRFGYAAIQIPNQDLGLSGLDQGTLSTGYGERSKSALASFLTRAEYDYKSKYLFTASFRTDGSSKLAPDNRWSYFPSAAFAWRMSRETFMKNISFIHDAKFRASYGVTGNNRVSDFSYRSSLSMPIGSSYGFGGITPERGIVADNLGNTNLKWENTSQIDLGYDVSFFKGKLDLNVDVYRKTTYDLLLNANIPYTTGYPTAYKNIGKVRNQGLEITLNSTPVKRKKFTWTSNFNISFNNNSVLALTEGENVMLSGMTWDSGYNGVPLYITEIGQPISMFYGYIWDGVYNLNDFDDVGAGNYLLKKNVPSNGAASGRASIKPGHIKYKDLNGDGIIDSKDATVIGDGVPKHMGGFNNNFKYNRFSLSVFFQWSYGNDVYNANRMMFEGNVGNRALLNQFASYTDRWSMSNQNSLIPSEGGQSQYGVYSSRVLEDASYLRLKTLSLGYSLPVNSVRKIGLKAVNLSLAMQNVLTWTKYSGMDPEVAVRRTALTPGFDYSAYPHSRTTTFKVSATF